MTYSWVACRATDGTVIAELASLEVSRVGVTLCDSWSGSASLALDDDTPDDWRRATLPKGTYLVLLDDGDASHPPQADPIWGGIITQRQIADTVTLGLATFEAYLGDRYVRDATFTDFEQCLLLQALVTDCVLTARPATPTPPALIVETHGTSVMRYRQYEGASSKTVLAAMQELAGAESGPEWTVTWRHLTAPERYVPVLTIADRIGSAKSAEMPSPQATFSMPGSVTDFSLVEDWTNGRAANSIVATSTAESADVPTSAVQVFADPERPTIEYRYSPSTSISDIDTLRSHAARALAVMQDGAVALSLTAAVEDAPRLGVDWWLGDDIGWSLACRSMSPGRMIPGDPDSPWIPAAGVDRCVGWEATTSGVETITPILASREEA